MIPDARLIIRLTSSDFSNMNLPIANPVRKPIKVRVIKPNPKAKANL
jgi:hypothetical protein